MRDIVRGVAIGIAALALFGAVASRAGWIDVAVPRPDGTGPWLLARATGYAALAALALDVIAGLLVSTRSGDRWISRAHLIELHGWLSPLALGLVGGHALVLLADHYVHFDLIDLLVPFVAPYRPFAVGLGVLAAYAAFVVHASFALRRRIGTKRWRSLHYLSFVAFTAAIGHAVLAGSDAARTWAIAVVALPVLGVAFLLARRSPRRVARGT